MLKIAITGTMGAGKTTVIQYLESIGYPVLISDEIVNRLYQEDSGFKQDLVDAFSARILDDAAGIDKRMVAALVFADDQALQHLEELIFPRVKQTIISYLQRSSDELVFVEVPLLLESGFDELFDIVLVVDAPLEIRLERLLKYRGIAKEEALRRMARQFSSSQKREKADYIIDNSGNYQEVHQQIDLLIRTLKERSDFNAGQ